MPTIKARSMAFTTSEESLARRLAVGVAVAWPYLSETSRTAIIAQAKMLAPDNSLAETTAEVEAFVAAHGAD